jgi:hypothetical protein
MSITINADVEFSQDEVTQLAGILNVPIANLDATLSDYAKAAVEEYVRMFIGQRVFTRGQDILEYRLFLLIQGPLGNHLPDDRTVSALFQTTASQSRALIRSVMSKYQYELQEAIRATLKDACQKAVEAEGEFAVILKSENVVDELNRTIANIDGALPPIERKRGTGANFLIKRSSYRKLCELYGLPIPPEQADD